MGLTTWNPHECAVCRGPVLMVDIFALRAVWLFVGPICAQCCRVTAAHVTCALTNEAVQ